MTLSKFLIISCAGLALAWIPGRAATDSDGTPDVTGAPTGTTSSTTTTHHRRHHTTGTASSTTNSASATASAEKSTTGSKSSKTAGTHKTGTASAKTESASDQTTASHDKDTSGTGKTSSTGTASTSGKHHTLKKGSAAKTETAETGETTPKKEPGGHAAKTETAATDQTPAKKETATEPGDKTRTSKTSTASTGEGASSTTKTETKGATPTVGAAAAAATVVNSPSAVATPATGHHHRHGKTTAAAKVPEPPIVISTVNVPPLPAVNPVAPLGLPSPGGGGVPTVETSLPVARPGAGTTATLSLALVRNPPAPVNTHFPFTDFPSKTRTYPWKRRIVTTVFWIGEGATPISSMTNKSSAWDINWVHDNGGADDQYDMSGYGSGSHASLVNPFYVALPFNDLAYPEKTQRWLPDGWYRPPHHGEKQMSSCQGRWVEIKNAAGRLCFAQWEDVGPLVTDDAEYVFGSAPPSAPRGLDVSPAVAKFLGFDSTAYCSWRFVDDDDVPPGLWLRYNEQAVLFQALKEQARHNTPIQELSQPVPDGTDDTHNEKEIRAGRG